MKYNHFWVIIFIFEYYGNTSWCSSLSLPPRSMERGWLPTRLFPPCFLSNLSILGDIGTSFHKSPQLGNTTQPFRNDPSCREQSPPALWGWSLTRGLLPQVCPWSSCAVIKTGPWQFSCGSQQALHTSHGLGRLFGRPFCPPQGSGCTSASSAWLLICLGMRGPEGSKGPWG